VRSYFYNSRKVKVGRVVIGGNEPVVLQSMTNTPTDDIDATVAQMISIFEAGAQLVRITVRNAHEVESLNRIKSKLQERGYNIPLVADIHFNYELAYLSAAIVEKVRVNPGNFFVLKTGGELYSEKEYQEELDVIQEKFTRLLEICKHHGTAVRIGINSGSLPKRVLQRFGHTPEAMVTSAIEFIDMARQVNFHDLIISLKGSDINMTIDANRLLAKRFRELAYDYPIHLGVTEAGSDMEGTLKSAIGIGTLLAEGIGHTIRVSLTGAPEKEIAIAKKIVDVAQQYALSQEALETYWNQTYSGIFPELQVIFQKPTHLSPVSSLAEMREKIQQEHAELHIDENIYDEISLAVLLGEVLLKKPIQTLYHPRPDLKDFYELLLQLTKRKITQADFISCPSCGRTTFDIENITKEVKEAFRYYKGITIAVMGCVVNGPGEISHADYGILGAKPGYVHIYVNGKPFLKNIPQHEAVVKLKEIIDSQRN